MKSLIIINSFILSISLASAESIPNLPEKFGSFNSLSAHKKSDRNQYDGVISYYSNLATIARTPQNISENHRGAAEIGVYQKASQGTVLIVSGDSIGSGALITKNGHILSNAHVTGKENIVTVFFQKPGNQKLLPTDGIKGMVKKIDEISDLVLIEIDSTSAPKYSRPIVLANEIPEVGADAHAIGHPAGQLWTYTKGYISQLRNDFEWINHKADVIQVQTPINPGNSGGPLLNSLGQLIGINSFKDKKNESMNFAVSINTIKKFLSSKNSKYSSEKNREKCDVSEGDSFSSNDTDEFGPSINFPMSTECDKKINMIIRIPNDKSKPIITYFDSNRDGIPDMVLADVDRDGNIDYSVLDLDYDGKFESKGIHTSGKVTPDKIVALD